MKDTLRPICARRSHELLARTLLVACLLVLATGDLRSGSARGQEYQLPPALVPSSPPAPPGQPPPPPPAAQPLVLLSPFPVVRMAGRPTRRGATIERLTVKAPVGSYVVSRCIGIGKRCPYKNKTVRVPGPRGAARTVHVGGFERSFRVGIVLRVYVVASARIGKFTSFHIRKGGLPRRSDRCVRGLTLTPVRCPGG